MTNSYHKLRPIVSHNPIQSEQSEGKLKLLLIVIAGILTILAAAYFLYKYVAINDTTYTTPSENGAETVEQIIRGEWVGPGGITAIPHNETHLALININGEFIRYEDVSDGMLNIEQEDYK